jgi:hypothetical protein
MKVIDPGHVFALSFLDGSITSPDMPKLGVLLSSTLTFVKREGDGYPGNVGHHPGTNLQEVLRALISRVKYLDGQESHQNNSLIIKNLRHAIWLLEQRAAERHGRPFELSAMGVVDINDSSIEDAPTCQRCGHVGCLEECKGRVEMKPSTFPAHIDRDGRGHWR